VQTPLSHGQFQFWSFRRVETSGGIRASLAGRYASALFDLARDEKKIDSVGSSLEALSQALAQSPEFRQLIASPLVDRDEAGKAFAAIGEKLKLDPITGKFLHVLSRNGRKGQLPQVARLFRRLASEHRGEATAEIVSAHPLTDDQMAALKSKLKARAGRAVTIDALTDPAILGGLVVKLGSEMIDSSLKTKLNRFALAMKG
jgi:F-type H+-transporting ATPase subunit delta